MPSKRWTRFTECHSYCAPVFLLLLLYLVFSQETKNRGDGVICPYRGKSKSFVVCYLMGSVFQWLSAAKTRRIRDEEEEQQVWKSLRMMQVYRRYIPDINSD